MLELGLGVADRVTLDLQIAEGKGEVPIGLFGTGDDLDRALAARARELVFRAPVREDDALLTAPPLKTRERIAALAVREAEWARQTSGNLATARAWLAQARDRLATRP